MTQDLERFDRLLDLSCSLETFSMRFQDHFSSVVGHLSSKSRIVEIVNHDGEAEAGNKNVSRQKSIANVKEKGSSVMVAFEWRNGLGDWKFVRL
jgi:hypothetical protein